MRSFFRGSRLGLVVMACGAALLGPASVDAAPPPHIVSVKLEARPVALDFDGVKFQGMAYNGDYAGPVIRVHPGDHLQVELTNHTGQPTNLHFHGMQTSPRGNHDNVAIEVFPGGRFRYEIDIPSFQPTGLFWYHAHVHGLTEAQVMGGLSGALIVEGMTERHAELRGIGEDLFVLKDIELDDSPDPIIDQHFHGLIQSINGKTMVEKTLRPGETRLWRFTNQSPNLYFHLALQGHRFRLLADDGSIVPAGPDLDAIDIKPAERIEVLVTGGAPGVYDLVSLRVPTDQGQKNRVLGHVTISGAAVAKPAPSSPAPEVQDLSQRPVDAVRDFEFSESADGTVFYMNHQVYDHTRMDLRVPLGNLEEWTIRNSSNDLHVFHIHQIPFQVTEINGVPQPFTGLVDVARVPDGGQIKIRLPFTNPLILGRFVFHCHVLKHEDGGMMANIEVYDPREGNLGPKLRRWFEQVGNQLAGLPAAICRSPAL